MHTCLDVDEIVRLIALELVTSGGRATAVGLACCCKSFEDSALDALWMTQDRLFTLLKSFPGDVWNKKDCTSFKRLPTTVEWARFRKYARRMRELSNRGTPSSPSLEVLSVIQFFVINEPLFPNLKTFCFLGIEEMFIPFIHLFLSPITTSINLSFKSNLPKATVASMVMTLPILCPNLQTITLGSLRGDPTIAAAVSGMLLVANRNALRLLSVECPLTEEASEVICKLPNLRSLSVVVGRRTSLPPASLPGLAKLVIKCDNEDGWPRLFHGATVEANECVSETILSAVKELIF